MKDESCAVAGDNIKDTHKCLIRIRLVESNGIALCHVINQCPHHTVDVRLKLKPSNGNVYSTTDFSWKEVKSKSRAIIAACVSPMYESMTGWQMTVLEDLEIRRSRVENHNNNSIGIFFQHEIK